ncbi:MAG: flagellar basal body-associated FliL family protein [Pseudomonadota bacterium]
MAQNEVEVDVGEGGGKGGLSMGKIVVILVAVQFLLVIIIGAALYFAGVFDGGSDEGGEKKAAEESSRSVGDPQYVSLESPFTVNFGSQGGARFMQVEVELMTYDKEAVDAIDTHKPVVRDRILSVLGNQDEEDVRGGAGKDSLRKEVLEVVQGVMEERYGKPAIEEVYFTSFVIQ